MRMTRNKQIYAEASEWLVDLRVGDMDAAAHKRLGAWLRESPHHVRAFLEVSATWEKAERPDLDRGHSTDELVERARASMNVVALECDEVAARRQGTRATHRWLNLGVGISALSKYFTWPSGVVAAVALACLGFGLVALNVYGHTHIATGTGEQRIVSLSDGSTIELNSKSRVRILFSDRERGVELVEGQALFKVAKDHTRPFVVQSAGMRVRAVGTQFDVYRKASGTQVTVVEGQVAVFAPAHLKARDEGEVPFSSTEAHSSKEEALPPVQLTADRSTVAAGSPAVLVSTGEQVTVTDQEIPRARPANLKAATAWTQQELVFEMTSLAEVAQEFNRYNTRKLVISDPNLAGFHVTGVFSTSDPALLLRFLRAQHGIDVTEVGQEIRISKQ